MPQSQRLSSAIPPVAFGRPACPRCKAKMMLASIEPARPGLDLLRLNVLFAIMYLRLLPRMKIL